MKTLVLGPTFKIRQEHPVGEVVDRLGAWVETGAGGFEATSAGNHFQVAISRQDRHRWSPWLTIEVRSPQADCDLPAEISSENAPADDLPESEVFGRFNPSPAIWTGYMLASLSLFTTALIAVMWAIAELMLGKPPLALWVVPACGLVLVVMWMLSAAGQRLATEQMDSMRNEIDRVLTLPPAP